MSEFYRLRRTAITDLTAFFGFLVGFIGSSPIAWPYLSVGFQTGNINRGFAYFIAIICGAALLCAAIGLVVGWMLSFLYEGVHRRLRRLRERRRFVEVAAVPTPVPAAAPRAVPRPRPTLRFDAVGVSSGAYLALLDRVTPVTYDAARIGASLDRTINIGAWDGERLVAVARLLSDGYRFAAVPEVVVDPDYRAEGIERELVQRAIAASPGRLAVDGVSTEEQGALSAAGGVPAGVVFAFARG